MSRASEVPLVPVNVNQPVTALSSPEADIIDARELFGLIRDYRSLSVQRQQSAQALVRGLLAAERLEPVRHRE